MPRLIRAFPVGVVWEGPAPRRDEVYAGFDRFLRGAGVTRLSVGRGTVPTGTAWKSRCCPRLRRRIHRGARNDDSLVLALRYREVHPVLAGDVESAR